MSPEFVVTSLVVCLMPGIGVIYTLSNALGGGLRRGLLAAFGCTLGVAPHVLAAVLGLSGVMQAGATAFEVIRWAGIAYLVFIAVSMLRSDAFALETPGTSERPMRQVVTRAIP